MSSRRLANAQPLENAVGVVSTSWRERPSGLTTPAIVASSANRGPARRPVYRDSRRGAAESPAATPRRPRASAESPVGASATRDGSAQERGHGRHLDTCRSHPATGAARRASSGSLWRSQTTACRGRDARLSPQQMHQSQCRDHDEDVLDHRPHGGEYHQDDPRRPDHGTTVGRTHSRGQWIGAHAQPLHEVRQACVSRWPGRGLATACPLAVRIRVEDNRGHGREIPAPCRAVTTYRRVCGLCGRAFAIWIPPGDQETERDKLCADCAKLPAPPPEAHGP
jgi:hypothetical protein